MFYKHTKFYQSGLKNYTEAKDTAPFQTSKRNTSLTQNKGNTILYHIILYF